MTVKEFFTARPKWCHPIPFGWAVLIIAVGGITEIIAERFGMFAFFMGTVFAIIALYFAASINWRLHTEPWFWVCLCSFVLLHVPLVFLIGKYVPMKGHIDGRGVVGIALADAAIMTAVIRFPDWITSSLEWIFSKDGEGTATK